MNTWNECISAGPNAYLCQSSATYKIIPVIASTNPTMLMSLSEFPLVIQPSKMIEQVFR
jgi:hypothetical protein